MARGCWEGSSASCSSSASAAPCSPCTSSSQCKISRQRASGTMPCQRACQAVFLLLLMENAEGMNQARRDLHAQEDIISEQKQADELAICAIVRDQQEGLREWVEWHRSMGVGRFYIMDYNSSKPTGREIADHTSSGLVDLFYSSNLQETTRYPQLYVYDICLTKFGEYHKWMAFLDVDEFLVLQPGAGKRKLPEFLKDYDSFGGFVANLKVFGSSGYKSRPQGSLLRNYIKCLPQQHDENRKVRTIVHTAMDPALHMLTPHNVRFRDQFYAVDEGKRPVKESFSTPEVITERIAVHKYPLKVAKAKAGSKKAKASSSTEKEISYYAQFDKEAQDNCISGKQAFAAAKNES